MQEQKHSWKNRLAIMAAVVLGGGTLLFLFSLFTVHFLVNLWWFDSVGYGVYFWQRQLYQYAVFAAVAIVFFLIFFVNFRFAARYFRRTQSKPSEKRMKIRKLTIGSRIVYIPLSLVLATVIAVPLFHNWHGFLFYFFGPEAGVSEPVFGKDVSYFLFSYPIYQMIQSRLLICFVLLFIGLYLLYWSESRLLDRQDGHLPPAAKWHLSLVLVVTFLIESWDFILQRNELVYKSSYAPLFFGPGFVDLKLTVPLIWLQLFLWTATVLCLVLMIHYNRGFKVFAGLLVGFTIVLGARYSTFLPDTVRKYIVRPNEYTREAPFITKNIQSTLQAYNLENVERRDFSPAALPAHYSDPHVKNVLRNIPLWQGRTLKPVLKQLQELRPYYTFPTVTVDRYTVEDKYAQVFVAPRELDYQNLPGNADNWINRHLIYTHGYGATMTPANQRGGSPMVWFMQGIPISSDYGMGVQQSGIYYGLQTQPYAIAPNSTGEMDYPKGNDNIKVDYQGSGGVPVAALLRRLVFSWYFNNRNLLFTTRMSDSSRILFRRNIVERIQTLTPFLTLDQTPYMVTTPRGIYWIQDAYTTTNWYPDAAPFEKNGRRFNYIRNSVKIVVDAYNGKVAYYIFDANDPIIRAYSRIYPTLFKDKAEMPADIREHVRYPRDLFDIQMHIYAKYHQTDPKVFYQEEDLWAYADEIGRDKAEPMAPQYLTLDLFQPDRLDFLLLVPMVPKGQKNLRAMAVAGCDGDNYGKLIVYEFPKGELVLSPPQTFAIINEEPKIAKQRTLWDQAGSRVVYGRMIILPIGHSIFYVQPIYLKSASSLQIPELQRIIVSEGQLAVMKPSLDEAYKELWQQVRSAMRQVDARYPPVSPGKP